MARTRASSELPCLPPLRAVSPSPAPLSSVGLFFPLRSLILPSCAFAALSVI